MRLLVTSLCLFMCLFAVPYAHSQTQLGTGSISGTVEDATGAVVVGATVTVTNTGTGLVRTITTNDAGQFNVPVLPSGEYMVRVEQQGFAVAEQQNLTVSVGRATTLRLELQSGTIGEVVNVTAEQFIDVTKTEETTLINRTQINDLPINGRRADQFALLAPGVTRDGRFGLLSYRGQSGVFNNFTLEGNDDNQAYFSEARGRTRIASNVSQNAIQEFQVGQSNFLPEFGRSAGGGINATVRSGTNTFSGDAFYYFRNQDLSARDPLSALKTDERRDQFGGSFSGAIIKDKLFFFVNYDQQLRDFPLLTQDLTGALNSLVTVGGAQVDRRTAAFNTASAPNNQANFTRGCQEVINRAVAIPDGGANALFSTPAGIASVCGGAGFVPGTPAVSSLFLTTLPRTFNQNLFLIKGDYNITDENTLSVTYNYLNSRGLRGIQTPLVLGNFGRNGTDDVRINSFNARLTSVITPRIVNEFRFQASRDFEFQFADEPPPQVFVNGTNNLSFGRATFLERPAQPDERRLQFINNLSYTLGNHSLKFGGELNRARDIIDNPANFGGAYNYPNVQSFGNDLNNPGARTYSTFTQGFGLPGLDFSTVDYAFFAQDQWKVLRNLTINYGLRYDYQDNPEPFAVNPLVPETGRINSDTTNLGPRIGIAYDIGGNGKTVVRGGYGLYYGRTPNGTIFNALTQSGTLTASGAVDPTLNQASVSLQPTQVAQGAPLYPNIPATIPSGTSSVFYLDPDFARPRLQEVNVGIEREIINNLSFSVAYVYTKGDRIPISFDANLPAPNFTRSYVTPDGTTFSVPFSAGVTRTVATSSASAIPLNNSRLIPQYGSITNLRSVGENFYNGLLVEVKRRFADKYQFNVAYTLAKVENYAGTDNGGGSGSESPFGGGTPQDQFAPLESFRAPAPTDQRHRLVINGIYNLPTLDGGNRFTRGIVNGFRLSGIYTAESGRPFSTFISVPANSFTFNGMQFTGFGGLRGQGGGDANLFPVVERNNTYGEANYRFDLRLARDIRLGERAVVELVAEGFNIFNTANFNGFNTTLFDVVAPTGTSFSGSPTAATPNPSATTPLPLIARNNFGVPTANGSQPDGTNARRFQLALRFRF